MEADWIWGLVGGLLIGSGGAVYLLGNGRIMGASGIIGGLVDGSGRGTVGERLIFLAGVFVLPLLLLPLFPEADTHLTTNPAVLVAAGLLVGIGTRLANGCTSGHGVCGISRLSLRGIVATGRGIPRPHMRVMLTADVPVGEVTSGTFSPTLRKGVGLALVAATVAADAEVSVDVRGRREVFALTKPPFVDPSVREA